MGSTAIRESKSHEAIGRLGGGGYSGGSGAGGPGVLKSNYAMRNRLAHVGDPQNFGEMAYEKRIKDL